MSRTIKTGTTWPPLRMLLSDEDGPVDLSTADSIQYYAKLAGTEATITGTFTPDSGQSTPPADGDLTGRGWVEHDFNENVSETTQSGTWHIWAGVTWAENDLEWFPHAGSESLVIEDRT